MYSISAVAVADKYRVDADVAAVSPNLDVVLELRDSDGVLIAAADPQETLGAEIIELFDPG